MCGGSRRSKHCVRPRGWVDAFMQQSGAGCCLAAPVGFGLVFPLGSLENLLERRPAHVPPPFPVTGSQVQLE